MTTLVILPLTAKISQSMQLTSQPMHQILQIMPLKQVFTSVSTPFNVPNLPGIRVTAQAASFDPAAMLTPLGAVSSNGLELRIGK